jgi:hypothetical protein
MFPAFNPFVIAVFNEGLQPVFFAGLRSAGGVPCTWAWGARGLPVGIAAGTVPAGRMIGALSTAEFSQRSAALDLATAACTA